MDLSTVLIYLKDLLATVMILLTMFSPAFGSKSDTYSAERPDELITSFAVISDVHVETNHPEPYQSFKGVLDGIKKAEDIDAVVYTGDNVMNGQILEDVFFYSAIKAVMPTKNNYVVTGNHDLGNGEGDYEKFRKNFIFSNKYVLGNDINELYYYKVVNGCYMIFMSSEALCVNDYVISDEQMDWLKGVLDEASAINAPIMVFNHHPIYLIRDRDYRELALLLQKYDNLVYFHGHYHNQLSPDSFYDWHNVDCINVPRATENSSYDPGSGLIVEVYDDEIVVRARDFINNVWLDDFRYTY
jgi:3',5'-cyclic AMP phosphodiesterase CpdA